MGAVQYFKLDQFNVVSTRSGKPMCASSVCEMSFQYCLWNRSDLDPSDAGFVWLFQRREWSAFSFSTSLLQQQAARCYPSSPWQRMYRLNLQGILFGDKGVLVVFRFSFDRVIVSKSLCFVVSDRLWCGWMVIFARELNSLYPTPLSNSLAVPARRIFVAQPIWTEDEPEVGCSQGDSALLKCI